MGNSLRIAWAVRAVFVTNDHDFLRSTKLAALRALGFPGEILRPAKAVAFLCDATGASLPVPGIEKPEDRSSPVSLREREISESGE